MIVQAAESLYWFNTTEPPYLIKGLPISLDSHHTTHASKQMIMFVFSNHDEPKSKSFRHKDNFSSRSVTTNLGITISTLALPEQYEV